MSWSPANKEARLGAQGQDPIVPEPVCKFTRRIVFSTVFSRKGNYAKRSRVPELPSIWPPSLEYLTAEILEGWPGKTPSPYDNKKTRIIPRHLQPGWSRYDEELNKLLAASPSPREEFLPNIQAVAARPRRAWSNKAA
ncbi:unnamed protein product [Staurois parvus]|uniref:Uncharacterized protein n=1 Tax=Staurois parvus TaxID=386267 RepID=A0ABN9AQ35_9NEOB|nr:unnamed protein product [Staurois parvus]